MKINNLRKKIVTLALCSLFATTCVPGSSFADAKPAPTSIGMQVNNSSNTTAKLKDGNLTINLFNQMNSDTFLVVKIGTNLVDYSTKATNPVTLTYNDGNEDTKIDITKNNATSYDNGMYRFFIKLKSKGDLGKITINDSNQKPFDSDFKINIVGSLVGNYLNPAPTINDMNKDIEAYFPIEKQNSYDGFIFYNNDGTYTDKFFFRPIANTSNITLNLKAREVNGLSYSSTKKNSFVIKYYNSEDTYNKIKDNGIYDKKGKSKYRKSEYYETSVSVTSSSSVDLPWYPGNGIIELSLKEPEFFMVNLSVKANPASVNVSGKTPIVENKERENRRIRRIGSTNRYATSIELSKEAFTSSDVAIVASGENFADSLSGGGLAGALNCPLLLVNEQYSSEVNSELNRLGVKTVYILGGHNSISSSVEHKIAKNNKGNMRTVIRLSGKNRYETSMAIYTEVLKMPKTIKDPILVNGNRFADALCAGPLAAKLGRAIVLTDGKNVSGIIDKNNSKNIVIGGYKSMDAGFAGTRIYGASRLETAVKVANSFYKPSTVMVASGENYADGLSSISLYNKYKSPLLLTEYDRLPMSVSEYITNNNVGNILIVGGTGSITKNVENHLKR